MQRDSRSERKPGIEEMICLARPNASSKPDSWPGTTSRRACSRTMREKYGRRHTVQVVAEWPTDGASPLDVVAGRLGSIQVYRADDPVGVAEVAQTASNPRMIPRGGEDLALFPEDHPQVMWSLVGRPRPPCLHPVK